MARMVGKDAKDKKVDKVVKGKFVKKPVENKSKPQKTSSY